MKRIEEFARTLKSYLCQRWSTQDVGVMLLESTSPRPAWNVIVGLRSYLVHCQPGKPEQWLQSAQWIAQKIEEIGIKEVLPLAFQNIHSKGDTETGL